MMTTMMIKRLRHHGNKNQNYRQFLKFCSTNGISVSIAARTEATTIRLKCFKDALLPSLELLCDMIKTPTFPKDQLENMKQSYAGNLNRINDYPDYLAIHLWKEMIFGKKSNLVTREGSVTDLKKITSKKINSWYQRYFAPQNFSLAVVGDVNSDLVYQTCNKLFDAEVKALNVNSQKAIITSSEVKFQRKKVNNDQAIIHLGGFGCKTTETDKNTAFHVLAQIIGGDTNSILFRELREKRGLGYSVEFDYYSNRLTGIFMASVTVDKKRETETIDLIKSIMANVKNNGISKDELEKTKNYIRGQRLIEEESILSQAQTLSVLDVTGFGYEYLQKRDERLRKVNLKSLRNIAAEYFHEDNYYIHVLS
jgi:predicted Zn-dependent peptidase